MTEADSIRSASPPLPSDDELWFPESSPSDDELWFAKPLPPDDEHPESPLADDELSTAPDEFSTAPSVSGNWSSSDNGLSLDDKLLAIFNEIGAHGLTLRTFLTAAFGSKHADIKHRVNSFISRKGLGFIVTIWSNKVRLWANDGELTHAAVDLVCDRVKMELRKICHAGHLRSPARSTSSDSISTFSFEYVEEILHAHAPTLTRLLSGLYSKKTVQERGTVTEAEIAKSTFITTIASVLVFNSSQQSNYLQMMLGLYFYGAKCPKRVISVLAAAGLSTSYQTVLNALEASTQHTLQQIRGLAQSHPLSLLYDNINFGNRKSDQRIDNRDTFESGTTATMVIVDDLGATRPAKGHTPPQLQDFLPDANNRSHFRVVTESQLVDVLLRHFNGFEQNAIPAPTIRILPITKTEAYPIPAMKIDQSSNEGNLNVLETVMERTLRLTENSFKGEARNVIISGDQLTTSRIHSLKELRTDDVTAFSRLEWAVPVMQLFHLQMLLCNVIYRTHKGNIKTPGSLAFFVDLLDIKRLGQDSPDYHTTDELLRSVFDAMVRRIWATELGTHQLEDWIERTLTEELLRNFPNGADIEQVHAFKNNRREELASKIRNGANNIREHFLERTADLQSRFGNSNVNAALFLRDMGVYMELCSAIRVGDIGRIEQALQFITVMFQAGGTKNYGKELLLLTYGIRKSWSEKWKEAVQASWLINTEGEANGFLPADLYQEHNNLLIKTIHGPKGSNMSWETLAKKISTNVRNFTKVAVKVEQEYAITHNSSFHSTVSTEITIQHIIHSLRTNNILSSDPCIEDRDTPLVRNMYMEGITNFVQGGFKRFIEKNILGGGLEGAEAAVYGAPCDERDRAATDIFADENSQSDEEEEADDHTSAHDFIRRHFDQADFLGTSAS